MAWPEDFITGSLGGVAFKWRSVTTRPEQPVNVVHTFYGLGQKSFVESVATSPWSATIDVYLIGDNYLDTKQQLEEVVADPGPHEFMHPTRGSIMVKLEQPAEFVESTNELGMVRIGQLTLVEAGFSFPTVFESTGPRLRTLALEAAEIMAANNRLGFLGAIDKVLDSITGALTKVGNRMAKVNGRVGAVVGSMAEVSAALNNISRQRDLLTQSPFMILGGLIGIGMSAFNALGNFDIPRRTIKFEEPTFGVIAAVNAAIRDLATFTTEPDEASIGVTGGPQLEIAIAAHREIQLQTNTLGYIAGASIAGDLPYASAAEASKMMTTIEQGLAATIADPGLPTAALEALTDLRATTIQHLLARKAELPRVVSITPPAVMPALVLAYELYGDPNRAFDLAERNRIRRPGFVPQGPLEVIVDE